MSRMTGEIPEPVLQPAPHRKSEDTSEGCRSLAKDDRDRAKASDSDHMRFRLACSAEAWSARADLLERLESNRAQIETEVSIDGPHPDRDDPQTGANQ